MTVSRRAVVLSMLAGGAIGAAGISAIVAFRSADAEEVYHYQLPRFRLTRHDGGEVTDFQFRWRPSVWFFGFTNCPVVCPGTLSEMSVRLRLLGPAADELRVVFVTLDPERDTQPLLKQYMTAFDPRIVALTGARDQIDALTRSFHVLSERLPLPSGDYTVNHTASVFLMASGERLVGTIDQHEDGSIALKKLQRLIAGA